MVNLRKQKGVEDGRVFVFVRMSVMVSGPFVNLPSFEL